MDRWKRFHEAEERYQKEFLPKLSEADGIRIFKELYLFAERLSKNRRSQRLHRLHLDKVRALSQIHALFNRVRS